MDILLKKSYCDTISQERNKAYGQYELRVSYPKRILKAQFIVLFSITCFVFGARFLTPEIKAVEDNGPLDPFVFTKVETRVLDIQLPKKPDAPAEKKPETTKPKEPESLPSGNRFRQPEVVTHSDTKPIDSLSANSEPDGQKGKNDNAIPAIPGGGIGDNPATNQGSGTENGGSEYGTSDKVHDWAQIEPKFQGDLEGFLLKSTHYPAKAISENVEGSVYVLFIVDELGKVTQPSILKGIGSGCDEEALRVMKTLPDFEPGKMNGKSVKVRMSVPFKFKLRH